MRRALSVWLPMFATDLEKRRLRRQGHSTSPLPLPPGAPGRRGRGRHPARDTGQVVLLTRAGAGRELVARCCASAARCGVSEGMNLAQARSFLPPGMSLHIQPDEPARDAAALHALACWALRYSPTVAPDGDDGLLLDTTGTERVHGGETRLVRRVAFQLKRLGFTVRVAAASTFACAWALARYGPQRLTCAMSGSERNALTDLPVAALGVDAEAITALAEVGIETIGELLPLPRHGVISRYGSDLLERLDHALGRAVIPESIIPVQPKPVLRAALEFDGPTDHVESVHAAARRVLEDLAVQLTAAQWGVRRLHVTLHRPYAAPECVEIPLSRPSANVKHLWKLVETRLERVDMGRGVEGITMVAVRTARLRHEQASSTTLGAETASVHDAAMGELIDTLVGRLGAENVVRAHLVQSHLPERAFRYVPVLEPMPAMEGVTTWGGADRPTLLYPRPEPASVVALTPDGPLLSLRWRGQHCTIITCIGPEHISAEWWRKAGGMGGVLTDRAYYAAQTDEGRWLFVCRQVGTGNWFVQGEWA